MDISGKVRGVDLSHNNSNPDFHAMVAGGVQYVMLKATQGASFIDPCFHDWRARAQSVGLLVGAYHFLSPGIYGATQYAHFARTVGDLKGMLVPALDIELDGPQRPPVGPAQFAATAMAWCARLVASTGRRPWVYSYHDMWSWLGSPRAFASAGFRLWLASYSETPVPLAGWTDISMLQYTDRGQCPGVAGGGVDCDVFLGTIEELRGMVM
jgi:lysozyme